MDILVAVWMVTYNHEKFIDKALQSVLSQKTNFSYKIFISDDYSTDATSEILKEFQIKHPERISVNINKKNLGSNLNGFNLYETCFKSGAKYVALIEGDDFWSDENKLQKQIEFLEHNSEYTICAHNTFYQIQEDILKKEKLKKEYIFKDYFHSSNINTVSVVYRNTKIPDWIINCPFGDWGLYLYLSKFGKTAVLDDYSAVYRIHNQGIYTGLNNKNEKMISFLEFIKEHFPENKEEINEIIIDKKVFLGLTSLSIGSILSGKTTFKELIYFFKTMVLRKLKRNTSHGVSHNH